MTTTTTILPPPVALQYSEKMLSTPMPHLVHNLFSTPRRMRSQDGNIMRMRRYNRLSTAPVPVNPQFLNPPPQQMTSIDIDARINWYSTFVILTREVTAVGQDPVLNQEAARLGQSLRETEDELMRTLLEGSASAINCTGGVNGDNPTEPTAADFEGIVTTLQNADCDFIGDVIEGENRFGTGPVRDSYFCMASTRLIPRLQAVAGFISKAQYPSQMNILSSEWGSVNNIRFVLSSRGSVTTNSSLLGADIYNMFITGQEAYSSIELDGESAKFIYHPPGLTTKTRVLVKFSLIDMDTRWGNMAQAKAA